MVDNSFNYQEYDKIICNSLEYLMKTFPDGKLLINGVNTKKEIDLYWLVMLNMLQTYGGKLYYSRNLFEYLKIRRIFKNMEIKFTFKKGTKIINIHKNFVCSDYSKPIEDISILAKIYKEYYKLGV